MQTSTSLTFFTAIGLAFSGALTEELMVFCWHVRTELYIYRYYKRLNSAWGVDNPVHSTAGPKPG